MAQEGKMMMGIMAVAVMGTVLQSVLGVVEPAGGTPAPEPPGAEPEPTSELPGPPAPIPEPTGEGLVFGVKNAPEGANYWSVCVHGLPYGSVGYDQKMLCALGVPINDFTLIFNSLPDGWLYPMCYRLYAYQKIGDDYKALAFVQSCNPAYGYFYVGWKINEYGPHVFDFAENRLYNKRFYDV